MMYAYAFLAAAVSFLLTPLTIILARRWGLVTDAYASPHPAHTHVGIIPRGGGIPIFFGLFLPLWYLIFSYKIVLFITLGALLAVIMGVLDDKYNLSPYARFIGNFVVASLVVAGGVGIPFITNPFNGQLIQLDAWRLSFEVAGYSFQLLPYADLAAIVWIVWCMNMVNWSKGVDGQLPGFVAVGALFLGILSQRFTRHDIAKEVVTIMSFATMGSYMGFLPWNFYPQKILPGYGAGSLAGYMLATLSILSFAKFGTLLLVLALPLTDAVLVMARRMARRRSPFRGDRGHFHHILLDMGWGRRRIAIFYWIVSLLVGLFSLYMSSEKKLFAFLVLFFVLAAIIAWSFFFVRHIKEQEGNSV